MYLHIGGAKIVAAEDIIGIFNMSIKEKQCNKEFLQSTPQSAYSNAEEIKSFIVTKDKIIFSPIASGTLNKRFQNNIFDK